MPRIAICAPSDPDHPRGRGARDRAGGGRVPRARAALPRAVLRERRPFRRARRACAWPRCSNAPTIPAFDAVWFARGGYGAEPDRRRRRSRGFDATRAGQGVPRLFRWRLPARRRSTARGSAARSTRRCRPTSAARAARRRCGARSAGLAGDARGLEPSLDGHPTVAFNLMTLAMLCGTPLMPDLAGHVVMVEEVAEHLYAVDRLFFHVTAHLGGIAGLRLGRVSDVPENDRPFGAEPEEIARYWCERHGIPFLGARRHRPRRRQQDRPVRACQRAHGARS